MRSKPNRSKQVCTWVGLSLLAAAVLLIVGEITIRRAEPILKRRVIDTLSTRFDSRVELDQLHASVLRGLEVSGDRLRIYPPAGAVSAGANQPLIAVDHFSFQSGVLGLFFHPMHVSTVQVSGLQINIPPRQMPGGPLQGGQKRKGKTEIVVDTLVCEHSRLVIGATNPGKEPKDFELKHIEMHDVGPNAAWQYDAMLVNAVPRGDIHAAGSFGPWQTENPGDSSVSGHYTFKRADLNTIKGISGTLSSTGDFKGQLDRILVDGSTKTPDFSLDTANHPMPLHTRFHAIVDGTSGDTYLQPVDAKLGDSSFTVRGAVISTKGKGHMIELDMDIPDGRIQDFLQLAVKTEPPFLTGTIEAKAKLHISPGKESVSQKLSSQGAFTLSSIHFTNPEVQDKVDMLSLRASGNPKAAKPGAPDVKSQMDGHFSLDQGSLQFGDLTYELPGASVSLEGVYSLDGRKFDFHGTVRTQATLSQMVASRWKSLMLKPISPFFKKNGAGAEIPVKISGTNSAPKFGLDVGLNGRSEKRDTSTAGKP